MGALPVKTISMPQPLTWNSNLVWNAPGAVWNGSVASSIIYLAYLSFYNNVKQAAKRAVVGADAIYQNLRRFFQRGSPPPPPTPPTP